MRRTVFTLVLAAAGFLVAAANPTPDPLLVRAGEIAWRSRDLAPRKVVTRTVVTDGKGNRLDAREETEILTGWEGDKPVFRREVKEEGGKSGLKVRVDIAAKDSPFCAWREGLMTFERKGDDLLAGRACATYAFEERPARGKAGEDAVYGTAWVEKETALPVKAEFHPKKLPSRLSSYVLTVSYEAAPEGLSVPGAAHLEMKGGFLFIKRWVTLDKTFAEWTAREAR